MSIPRGKCWSKHPPCKMPILKGHSLSPLYVQVVQTAPQTSLFSRPLLFLVLRMQLPTSSELYFGFSRIVFCAAVNNLKPSLSTGKRPELAVSQLRVLFYHSRSHLKNAPGVRIPFLRRDFFSLQAYNSSDGSFPAFTQVKCFLHSQR